MNARSTTEFEVTGLGIVNAAGSSVKDYWEALATGSTTYRPEHLFGPTQPAQRVMRVEDHLIDHGWSARYSKRLDRLTLLASAAMREAMADAALETAPGQSDRVGIFVGNCTGGWTVVEPQLYPLYRDGDLNAISPYVATAWFPTASQGEVSIAHGIGGCSKTFCAENLSAAFALRQACWALADGTLDVAVVCGAEAPLTPLVYNACVRNGLVSLDGSYLPYTFEADGALLGEGAAALVLEAVGRPGRPHGTRSRARIGGPVLGRDREAVTRTALQQAGLRGVDYVALEGRGQFEPDMQELCALEGALDGDVPHVGTATGSTGALLGASFATSLVTSCIAVEQNAVPGGTRVHAALCDRVRVVHDAVEQRDPVRSALALGTDTHDQAGAVIVRAAEPRG